MTKYTNKEEQLLLRQNHELFMPVNNDLIT